MLEQKSKNRTRQTDWEAAEACVKELIEVVKVLGTAHRSPVTGSVVDLDMKQVVGNFD